MKLLIHAQPEIGVLPFAIDMSLHREAEPPMPPVAKETAYARKWLFSTPMQYAHVHGDHEILLLTHGSGYYLLDDHTQLPVGVGDIVIIPAGVSHYLQLEGAVAMRGLYVTPDIFKRLLLDGLNDPLAVGFSQSGNSLPPRVIHHETTFRRLQVIFDLCMEDYARPDRLSPKYARTIGELVATIVLRLFAVKKLHNASDSVTERVQAVKEWMDQHYRESFTLDDLATRAAISPSRFLTLFHQYAGTSPIAYVRLCRVREAATLLTQSQMPITEIAERVAIPLLPQFSRAFKKVFGVSPNAYRRAYQQCVPPVGEN